MSTEPDTVRLQRLELESFRGFESLGLDFEPDLTVLVGANGTGKSTVLDAIVCAAREQPKLVPTVPSHTSPCWKPGSNAA